MVCPERKDVNRRESPSAKTEGVVVVFNPWTKMVLVPSTANVLSINDCLPGNSSKFQSSDNGELSRAVDDTILSCPLTLEYVTLLRDPRHWKTCEGKMVIVVLNRDGNAMDAMRLMLVVLLSKNVTLTGPRDPTAPGCTLEQSNVGGLEPGSNRQSALMSSHFRSIPIVDPTTARSPGTSTGTTTLVSLSLTTVQTVLTSKNVRNPCCNLHGASVAFSGAANSNEKFPTPLVVNTDVSGTVVEAT